MAERDWQRIRRGVDANRHPIPFAANLGWAFVGLCGGAVLFLIGWLASYSSLPEASQEHASWVTPTTIVIIAFCLIVIGLSFVMNNLVEKKLQMDVDAILADMDDCHPPKADS